MTPLSDSTTQEEASASTKTGAPETDSFEEHATVSTANERSAADPETVLGLNRGDQRVITVLVVVSFLLLMFQWYKLTQYRPEPIVVLRPDEYRFQLDVNDSTWVEWMQLDGIGEMLARRIIEDRELRRPFESVDDVQRVRGIGPKTLDKLRPHLVWKPPATDEETVGSPEG